MAQKRTRKPMSAEHKAALAEGRNQGRAVRVYLEALDAHRPKRGRKRTPDSMKKRLDRIESSCSRADPLKRVQLIQERLDLKQSWRPTSAKSTSPASSRSFVAVGCALQHAQGHLLRRLARAGVEPAVLKRAGISRSS